VSSTTTTVRVEAPPSWPSPCGLMTPHLLEGRVECTCQGRAAGFRAAASHEGAITQRWPAADETPDEQALLRFDEHRQSR
jgi:hypothetical protein